MCFRDLGDPRSSSGSATWGCDTGSVTSFLEPQFPHLGKGYNSHHPFCLPGFCEIRVTIILSVMYLDGSKLISEQKAIGTKYI